jgi:amino acid permease
VGSGWLALPKIFAIYGYGSGCALGLIATVNSMISIRMMANLMNKYKKCDSMSELVAKILGPKAAKAMSIIFTINLFGSLIAYSLIANSFLCSLIEAPMAAAMGSNINDPHFQSMLELGGLAALMILTIPLQLMNNTSVFGKIGMFTIFTLVFVMYVVIEQAADYAVETKSEVKAFNFDSPLLMIQNLGVWTFNSYLLDPIFLIKKDMGKVTEKRILIFGGTGLVMVMTPYILFGIIGYISVGDLALGLDLFPDRAALPGSPDFLMTMVKALLIGVIMIAYLVRFIALKLQVFSMLGKTLTKNYNILYTVGVLGLPSAIGFVYPAVNAWIGLIGAFCMTTLGTTYPAMMMMKEMKAAGAKKSLVLALRTWSIVFTAVGYVSAVSIVMKMAHFTD